eukprot:759044-Hanusia_phi.AAC.5
MMGLATGSSHRGGCIKLISLFAALFVFLFRQARCSSVATYEALGDHPPKICSEGNLKYMATRLHPGDELKSTLGELCAGKNMFVLSCVGSVSCATIRCANYLKSGSGTANDIKVLKQRFEIVSLVGSICGSPPTAAASKANPGPQITECTYISPWPTRTGAYSEARLF